MKKLILSLLLFLPLVATSQSNDFGKQQKRNQQFFNQRNFHTPNYYRFYPNYHFWYPNYLITPTYYYPTTSTRASTSSSDLNLSAGLNLPISHNEPKVGFGVYMTFGKDIVFITSFDMIDLNSYMYYSNISYRDVLSWGDKYVGKEYETYLTNFGLGKRFGNFVPYVSVYILSQTEYWAYFDDAYILSNTGYYTIYSNHQVKFGPAFGTLYDVNKLQLNINFNPQRNIISLGAGMKF
jgi:hypothetical protein